ncbi:MAG: DUF393 domain-containing protein [Deltaproteobacteria bacterium]|nr:DUF393 domain-containing protein [Deltaproteobacteria bacterium]
MSENNWKFKILYDGGCPICKAEIAWLKGKDRKGSLLTEDISAPAFESSLYGKSLDELMGSIHGVFPGGHIVSGIDAVIELYRAVGLGWLWLPAKLPFVRPFYDLVYSLFALYRFRYSSKSGICESGRCSK